jgi:hypothetical protein
MADLVGAAAAVGLALAGAGVTWIVKATGTSKDVERVAAAVGGVKTDHGKRLDDHDLEIRRISQDFVPRHELDAKLQMTLDPINKQLDHQRSLLEYAVMGKRPEAPELGPRG